MPIFCQKKGGEAGEKNWKLTKEWREGIWHKVGTGRAI